MVCGGGFIYVVQLPHIQMAKNDQIREWLDSGLKGATVCICGLIVYSYQQLNGTLKELTIVTRAIELRVTAIEADRTAKGEQYRNFVTEMQGLKNDFQSLKVDFSQLTARFQTLADFIARRVK